MANDADWVNDVKRWVRASMASAAELPANGSAETAPVPLETGPVPLGYEAAHPALELRRWQNSAQAPLVEPR